MQRLPVSAGKQIHAAPETAAKMMEELQKSSPEFQQRVEALKVISLCASIRKGAGGCQRVRESSRDVFADKGFISKIGTSGHPMARAMSGAYSSRQSTLAGRTDRKEGLPPSPA
jgi:hypothetical protein